MVTPEMFGAEVCSTNEITMASVWLSTLYATFFSTCRKHDPIFLTRPKERGCVIAGNVQAIIYKLRRH